MIESLAERFDQERGVRLEIEQDAIAYLAEKGYSPDFGARELERTVSSILETYLANYLLINNVKRGDNIIITRDNLVK
jgi:ATP-dependent Clp protease ATP-binding subunit ClpA